MSIDLSSAWGTAERIVDQTISLLPNLILGLFIFIIFLFLGALAKSAVSRLHYYRQRPNVALLLGRLLQTFVLILGFLIAFSVVAPSFHAADLIKMLDIGSVAIGFAFQNILQNFLAGILLLINEPFHIGDVITVNGLEGTVDDVQTGSTLISTADGHRVVVPNTVLFTNPVVMRHAHSEAASPGPAPSPNPNRLTTTA